MMTVLRGRFCPLCIHRGRGAISTKCLWYQSSGQWDQPISIALLASVSKSSKIQAVLSYVWSLTVVVILSPLLANIDKCPDIENQLPQKHSEKEQRTNYLNTANIQHRWFNKMFICIDENSLLMRPPSEFSRPACQNLNASLHPCVAAARPLRIICFYFSTFVYCSTKKSLHLAQVITS